MRGAPICCCLIYPSNTRCVMCNHGEHWDCTETEAQSKPIIYPQGADPVKEQKDNKIGPVAKTVGVVLCGVMLLIVLLVATIAIEALWRLAF